LRLSNSTPCADLRAFVKALRRLVWTFKREQLLWLRQALQNSKILLAEPVFRASHKIFERARHQDLPSARRIRYARCRVDGESFNTSPHDFALARMDANPEIDADTLHRGSHFRGKLNCSAWAIENQEESVAGGINLAAMESLKAFANQGVMAQKQGAPNLVPDAFQRLR
jgi:hypothetical protein